MYMYIYMCVCVYVCVIEYNSHLSLYQFLFIQLNIPYLFPNIISVVSG